MKINKPSIDILVGITNRELLHGNMSTTAYGEVLARAKQELENLKDIIKKLTFDLIGKCKELGIDYKDLIAQSK